MVHPGSFGAKSDEETPIDALGYTDYAKALANVISDKQTGTPLTVAICAPWGRGKTVLMDYIEEQLNKVEIKDPNRKQTTCIRVSAWEFSKTSEIWAELYSRIIIQGERALSWPRRLWFRLEFWRTMYPRSFWSILIPLAIALRIFISWLTAPDHFFTVDYHVSIPAWPTEFADPLKVIGTFLGIPAVGAAMWKFFGRLPKQVLRNLTQPGSKQKPGTEQEVLSNIKIVQPIFQRVSEKRIVVFVDDIDRASESKILQVLEAIKLFLQSKEFVFVLAMDTKVVRRAVGSHYKFAIDENGREEDWGRAYLEKIIQIPFHLPHLTEKQREDLCKSILESYESDEGIEPDKDNINAVNRFGSDKDNIQEDKFTISPEGTNKQPEDEKSDQITDPEPVAESDRGTDNKDQYAYSYRGGLDPWESDIIKTISSQPDLELSPRLLKRFINIYLVARQLHQLKSQHSKGKIAAPRKDFIKWLALSVAFPFEIRALTKWLEENNWDHPLGPSKKPFDNSGKFLLSTNKGSKFNKEIPRDGTPFVNLDTARLNQLGRFINQNGLDMNVVEDTLPITSCFSLILD